MQTEAVFDNIAERIVKEVSQAQRSIHIAVAWFTNRNIFNALVQKAQKGCQVQIMFSGDPINDNSSIDYDLLNTESSNIFRIGDGDRELMHNKFCVIDHCTVLTGSYNWSYKAEYNFENIVVTYDDTALAEQYLFEFNKIKQRYYPESQEKDEQQKEFPLHKIIKRLEILKNFVHLEEIDELDRGTNKLKEYTFNKDIERIIHFIENEDYGDAVNKIENFITSHQQIAVWNDAAISALKLGIKNLENQINAFDNERIEIKKVLADFQHRHSIELGKIILKILNLRKQKFKDYKKKFEEAKRDQEEYEGQLEEEKEKELFELSDNKKRELKKKFRKATTLCHPDRFTNETPEIQKQAESIFKELNEANAKNQLDMVSEILQNLEQGNLSSKKGNSISDKEILRATIERLKGRLKSLKTEIIHIKQSETYQTINAIEDWDSYFSQKKEQLQLELESLQKS